MMNYLPITSVGNLCIVQCFSDSWNFIDTLKIDCYTNAISGHIYVNEIVLPSFKETGQQFFIFTKLLKIKKSLSAIASVLIGAFIFTSVHYIGTLKDSFTYAGFTFRLLAGLVLSAIFMFRGLGVVVYTHAIYDVLTILKPFHI